MAVSHRAKSAGFTLIELIITIVVISAISVVIGRLLYSSFNTYTVGSAINTMSVQALMGVERMAYDLRNASSLTTIASNSFTFVDQAGTSYTYSLSGALLQRGNYTLLDSAQSLSLTYLDQNGSVTAVPANVQYVKISLSMLNNTVPLSYTTIACLRGTI